MSDSDITIATLMGTLAGITPALIIITVLEVRHKRKAKAVK